MKWAFTYKALETELFTLRGFISLNVQVSIFKREKTQSKNPHFTSLSSKSHLKFPQLMELPIDAIFGFILDKKLQKF